MHTKFMISGFAWTRFLPLTLVAVSIGLPGNVCLAHFGPAFNHNVTQADAAENHYVRGLQLAQNGELQAAEDQLRAAVKLRPEDAEYLSSLATLLAIEKKLEESTTFFELALKIKPGDLRAQRDLSANLWQLQRYAEAKRHLKILLRQTPADPQAKLLLGLVSEKTGDYSVAAAMLQSIPDVVKTQPEALLALARSYYQTGQRMQAASTLSKLENGPAGVQGVVTGAQVAEEMRDYATAENLLATIPRESPEFQTARYHLAVAKFNSRQYEQSQQILQELINSGHKNGQIFRLAGWCFHKTKRDEDAIRTFREAIQLDPTDERNFLDLGALLVEQRKFSSATELANRTISAFPASADALALLGSIEFATGHFTDAVQTYSRSLQLNQNNAGATLGLAKAQAAAGMNDQATKTLEGALQRFQQKAVFELQLALLLLKESANQGSPLQVRAEKLLQSAATHDPDLAEAQYQLAELDLRRGQTTLAISRLQKAATISPESAKTHFALARAYRRAGRTEDAARETAFYEKLNRELTAADKNSGIVSPRE